MLANNWETIVHHSWNILRIVCNSKATPLKSMHAGGHPWFTSLFSLSPEHPELSWSRQTPFFRSRSLEAHVSRTQQIHNYAKGMSKPYKRFTLPPCRAASQRYRCEMPQNGRTHRKSGNGFRGNDLTWAPSLVTMRPATRDAAKHSASSC